MVVYANSAYETPDNGYDTTVYWTISIEHAMAFPFTFNEDSDGEYSCVPKPLHVPDVFDVPHFTQQTNVLDVPSACLLSCLPALVLACSRAYSRVSDADRYTYYEEQPLTSGERALYQPRRDDGTIPGYAESVDQSNAVKAGTAPPTPPRPLGPMDTDCSHPHKKAYKTAPFDSGLHTDLDLGAEYVWDPDDFILDDLQAQQAAGLLRREENWLVAAYAAGVGSGSYLPWPNDPVQVHPSGL